MPHPTPSRRLDALALATGLLFSVAGIILGALTWAAAGAGEGGVALAAGAGTVRRVTQPLGVLVFFLAFFDVARYPRLRARRVAWRLGAMGCVLGIALVDALLLTQAVRDVAAGVDVGTRLAIALGVQTGAFVLVGVAQVAAHRAPGPPALVPGERYAARWVPPIFGTTPELPARQWQVLGLMIAASFFNAYDMHVFGLALKQIQAGLAIEERHLGLLGSAIGAGVVPGVLLALCADIWGRRRILLVTITGYTLFTGLTAFAPNETVFLICQFAARAFGTAELVLATVVVAEEVDTQHRGWALGVLSALAFMGVGLALMLFAFVERLPMGWRAMYLVGFVPLIVITALRRRLPETVHFARYERTRAPSTVRASLRPLVSLVRVYPARFAAIGSVRFLNAFATQAAMLFVPKYLQEEHAWDPERFALVGAVIGFGALCALPLLGRLGDRIGRKPVSIVLMTLVPLSILGLYNVETAALLLVPLLWFGLTVSDGGADMHISTFSNELFPTSYRSTASSARQLVGQLGGSLGLAMQSVLYTLMGSHALAISIVALPALLMPLIVGLALPETSGRPLDEIAPEPEMVG